MLNALNEVLRDDFIKDSIGGVERWNKVIEKAGIAVPSARCRTRRSTARSARSPACASSPDGQRDLRGRVERECHAAGCPTAEDRAFVASLMGRVVEPGKFASWIAPPAVGVNRQPVELRVRSVQLTAAFVSQVAECGTHPSCPTRGVRSRVSDRPPTRARIRAPASHRPGDLHSLQHLRGDLPGQRDHARLRATTSSTSTSAMAATNASRRVRPAPSTIGARSLKTTAVHAGRAVLLGHPAAARTSCEAVTEGEVPDEVRAADRDRHGGPGRPGGAAVVGRASVRQPLFARQAGHRDGHRQLSPHGDDASADIRHIVLDFGNTAFPVLEGQTHRHPSARHSTQNGRPHHVRLYSVASPRDGERPRYNNFALTIKRVTEDHDGKPVAGVGIELHVRSRSRRPGQGRRSLRHELSHAQPSGLVAS